MSGKEPKWKFNEDLKGSGTYPWKYGIESVDWTSTERAEFKYWATLNDAALKTNFEDKDEVLRFQDKANDTLNSLHNYNKEHGMPYLTVDGMPGKNTMDFVKKVNSKMEAYRVSNPMNDFD
jgi:hypothetical protein